MSYWLISRTADARIEALTLYPRLKNPRTDHWDRDFGIFDLLL